MEDDFNEMEQLMHSIVKQYISGLDNKLDFIIEALKPICNIPKETYAGTICGEDSLNNCEKCNSRREGVNWHGFTGGVDTE